MTNQSKATPSVSNVTTQSFRLPGVNIEFIETYGEMEFAVFAGGLSLPGRYWYNVGTKP
jgi:hypothetical protein